MRGILIGVCALQMSTKADQTLRYSSTGYLQMKDRCEVNFKRLYWIDSEIYCLQGTKPDLLIVFTPFCVCG